MVKETGSVQSMKRNTQRTGIESLTKIKERMMPTTNRYWHHWICDDTDDEVEFDIVVVSEEDSYWEPGYEDITDSEFLVNDEEVTYHEFVERTGWDQADMSNERYRIDL
jgi:hypothetical protein